MKIKIFLGLFFVGALFFFGCSPTPSVQSPKSPLELSIKKEYQFSEVVSPKTTTVLKAQLDTTSTGTTIASSTFWDIVKENWGALVMAFLALIEVVVRLTPTLSDNSIFNLIKKILDAFIPNNSKSGGVHP